MKVLEGKSGIWCLGPGGVALLPPAFAEAGRLTPEGQAEVRRVGIDRKRPADRYSLTVVTATNCNLGCPYCFQNTGSAAPGRFDPPRIEKLVLDSGTIERIAGFARSRMRAAGVNGLFVLLFGGEPLLNPAACLDLLVRLGRLAPVSASMVTNGVLLHARSAVDLEAAGLRSAQITLDGPAALHDRLRATRAGRPTFDRIVDNIAAAQQNTALTFNFRINTTPEALPFLEELIHDLATRVDASRCAIDIAPVLNYAAMFDSVLDRSASDVATILRSYATALDEGFQVGWPSAKSCGFCTERDGATGAVVNADGTLYSCWETIGKPGYEVGSIDSGYHDYDPAVWVSCGEFAVHQTTEPVYEAFDRALTVGLLEMLRSRGPRPRQVPAGHAEGKAPV
ncbi:radical SAM protein [Streptomyces sp. NPDC006739]|uniref:radical SAM protein n=1 Tax=Streptomyces sp. NPDC006739 TaxID=3364763 RepID=UPI0036B22C50